VSRPFIVGLTGGIGSGKSLAAEHFARLGARIVDTDAIAHQLTAPGGAAIAPIREAFGEAMITPEGALNRPLMRECVFSDSSRRARLEAILHPMIRHEALARCGPGLEPYVVLVVPLLVEHGYWQTVLDRIVVVDCEESQQRSRVAQRSALSEAQIQAILDAQAGRAERLALADDVIDNRADPAFLQAQVAALHQKYCALARSL
jgi:dephospho-CoA kinase